jgi:hypothetical protein
MQLLDTLDFEGNETPENRIVNFLRHFIYDFFLIYIYIPPPEVLKFGAGEGWKRSVGPIM